MYNEEIRLIDKIILSISKSEKIIFSVLVQPDLHISLKVNKEIII